MSDKSAAYGTEAGAIGTLRWLTVSPKTSQRYSEARHKFYSFLRTNSLEIPRKREQLDTLLAEYIEHLWSEGEGRGLAFDTVAGIQDAEAKGTPSARMETLEDMARK